MKKKRKKGKKGAFDLEAFEKELGEGTGGNDDNAADKDGGDDADLGDDPFARDGDAGENVEAWQGTNRDYTYQEVGIHVVRKGCHHSPN